MYEEPAWAAVPAEAWAQLDTEGMSEWEALGTRKELMHKCAAQVAEEMPERGLGGEG